MDTQFEKGEDGKMICVIAKMYFRDDKSYDAFTDMVYDHGVFDLIDVFEPLEYKETNSMDDEDD